MGLTEVIVVSSYFHNKTKQPYNYIEKMVSSQILYELSTASHFYFILFQKIMKTFIVLYKPCILNGKQLYPAGCSALNFFSPFEGPFRQIRGPSHMKQK